jgi:tRNA (cmo5U34)-methyltransferase
MTPKSSPDEIRDRFDGEVERFSNLETGQSATMDAPLVLDLLTRAAAIANPNATRVLDVGCGAGNYSLKLVERLPHVAIDIVDLSGAMLSRATERLKAAGVEKIARLQGDIRVVGIPEERYDIVVAAAVLHHLRTDDEWKAVFARLYRALKPGGSLWISDLIEHSIPAVRELMWERYGDYLVSLRDEEYRDLVFSYIEREDTPKPLVEQLDLLRQVGFVSVDVLHKSGCFAAFGAVK